MEHNEFSLDLVAGASGFGSGEHPTTHTVLQVLYALATEHHYANILDMGCGAGLLAMTAAHLWPQARVLAADIQASAVQVAGQNIAHNGLQSRIDVIRSDGYRHAEITARAPFDLIICNMTADPVVRLASGLRQVLAEEGLVILSGILVWRSAEILALHAQMGLEPVLPVLNREGWETHILAKHPIA